MSLIPLTPDKFEQFTLVTHPSRSFASSSSGITGSITIHARVNRTLKESSPYFSASQAFFEVPGPSTALSDLRTQSGATNIHSGVQQYLDLVNSTALSVRHARTVGVQRIVPTTVISSASQKKAVVKDVLLPYYRSIYPSADYAYVNYNCLNFFTASTVPTGSVIIYPVSYSGNVPMTYVPTSSFTLDFYLNPRYVVSASQDFRAGTILHVSSTLALSLVTGSQVDHNGVRTGFRLLLQLSQSTDILPSSVSLTASNNSRPTPGHLIFLSEDNSLRHNRWHHVSVRWGTSNQDHGTGTFFIDGVSRGTFSVPSGSITTQTPKAGALFLGNYFEGLTSVSQSQYFNANAASSDGVRQYSAATTDPTGPRFTHPFNGEIHDVKIFSTFRSQQQILTSSQQGPTSLQDLLFYLPVHFVRDTRPRNVLVTPTTRSSRSTYAPINTDLTFNVGGHEVNLENFLREMVSGEHPRLLHLTSSAYTGSSVSNSSADDYLNRSPELVRRNLTVLPCDNGLFIPNFDLLLSGAYSVVPSSGSAHERFVTDQGGLDLKLVSLRNLVSSGVLQVSVSGALESEVYGASPENVFLALGSVPAVFQRTRDASSNAVVLFDASNLLYGRRLMPGSVVITDLNVTGSSGRMQFNLRDDGRGGLYRADASTDHAKWNAVGNVFYNEGVILVKSPHLPSFGKISFKLDFSGERNIYTKKLSVVAGSGQVNSSSNPNYVEALPSLNANENDDRFVYLTGITIHNENLNVVARANFAQPILKRSDERIVFKLRLDF